jgi:hypothetical protein
VAVLAATACSTTTRSSAPATDGTGGGEQGLEVAEDVVIDIAANGHRLVVRNQRPTDVFVLDTAFLPRTEERDGTLTLTYVRPGATTTGEEPVLFEAVPVESSGVASIEPGYLLTEGDRLRYCLEVVDPVDRVGGGDTRVHDREQGQPATVACSDSYTVR